MNKFNAQKTVVCGIEFDSKREAERYIILAQLERRGLISDLRRQVEYELIPVQREPDIVGKRGGVKQGKVIERPCSYVADFVYINADGVEIVEDVKGYKKGAAYAVFSVKRKLMLWIHGIRVIEV